MRKKSRKQITVRSVGAPSLELAANFFAPLVLKIHRRNQAKISVVEIANKRGGNGR